jgi:hypothetical protein
MDLYIGDVYLDHGETAKAVANFEEDWIKFGCDMKNARPEFLNKDTLKPKIKIYDTPEEYYTGEIETLINHESLHVIIYQVSGSRHATINFDNIDFYYEISDYNL